MMRKLLLTLCFLMALATPSLAQTTTFSTDCDAAITITGAGLTLTSTKVGNFVGCRAGTGKQSGLLYFTFTLNHAPVATVVGIANGGSGSASALTFSTAAGYLAGNNLNAAVVLQNGQAYFNNVTKTAGGALTSGQTGAFVLNMDTDPRQFWVTSDIAGTSGYGGGPLWNGDVTSSPTLLGTGQATGVFPIGSTAGTGFKHYIYQSAVWPIWQGQNLDSATFSFAANTTLDTLLAASGYKPWNDTSGVLATPGPLNPPTAMLSNAPGWTSGGVHTAGDRINAGAGWNGSAYTSGLAVCLFGLVTPGTSGSSASAFNTACASGTPANTGGIPGGSWPGATTVTDGSVTWALLTRVDFVTLTEAVSDSVAWAPSTPYPGGAWVHNGGIIYQQTPDSVCVSGSGGGPPASDGTCSWLPGGSVVYASGANSWPHELWFNPTPGDFPEMGYNYNPTIMFWYGGSKQQLYGPQQPGENNPTVAGFHADRYGDAPVYCFHGFGIATINGNGGCDQWTFRFTVAPGDSFQDNFTAATPLAIDATKGVTVSNTGAWGFGPINYWNGAQEPFATSDTNGQVDRLQLLSLHGIVAPNHSLFGPGNQHANLQVYNNNIMQSGDSGYGVFFCDGGCTLLNNVLIDGSTVAGSMAAHLGYEGRIVANNTFIGNGSTNSVCISNSFYGGSGNPGYFYNNYCGGFAYPYNHDSRSPAWPSIPGSNNATTSPAGGYGGSYTDANGQPMISYQLPGVNTSTGCGAGQASPCSGLTAANQLVNGASDARIKSTSADIYGAGINYAPVTGVFPNGSSASPVLDTISQTWSPRWDIGAEKFFNPPPILMTGPGRLLIR